MIFPVGQGCWEGDLKGLSDLLLAWVVRAEDEGHGSFRVMGGGWERKGTDRPSRV